MTDLHDDLDAYELPDEELEAAERDANLDDDADAIEAPPDAEKAEAMMRVVRGLDRELRRIDMLATQEMSRIESWRNDRSAGLKRRRDALLAALEQYARAVHRLAPKRKTIDFPHGKLALRAPRPRVVIDDEPKFLEWWREDARMRVAVYLRDLMDADADTIAAEVVELVLTRSSVARCKIEPNKTAIAGLPTGPTITDDDEQTAVAVVLDGEAIPHVAVVTSKHDTFSPTVTP